MASKHMKRHQHFQQAGNCKLSPEWGTNFHALDGQKCKNLSMTSIGGEESELQDLLHTADGNVNLEKFDIIY